MNRIRRAATLPVRIFDRPAEVVARELLGAIVISRVDGLLTAGRIVETEAYLGFDDPASHGYRHRRNERNSALFGAPGTWYVYLSYGVHWCANLVCEEEGRASAVLLRAVEPLRGLEIMAARRGTTDSGLLCSGPGKLCQALGITRELDGLTILNSPVTVVSGPAIAEPDTEATPRIGITKAADWPLRYAVAGSPWTSRARVSSPGRSLGARPSSSPVRSASRR
ncbi:MAG: DNA-3-methyladenine glycosylase [Gemmatimonadales bacterium]